MSEVVEISELEAEDRGAMMDIVRLSGDDPTKWQSNIRHVIHTVPGVHETVGIGWPRFSRSGEFYHDHGESYGFTFVKSGQVIQELIDGTVTLHVAGDWFTEEPDTKHRVFSIIGAETLHFYTPPPRSVKQWERETGDVVEK